MSPIKLHRKTSLLFALSLVATLPSCGSGKSPIEAAQKSVDQKATNGGPCAGSELIGTWQGQTFGQTDTLTFSSDCTGSESFCSLTFTYPSSTLMQGSVSLNIQSSRGGTDCAPAGEALCNFSVTDQALAYSCNGGPVFTYTKQ